MSRLPLHNLDEGGRLRDGWIWMDRRRWPGIRILWLWMRQGFPRDFPVIVEEGTITALARSVDDDGKPEINAEDIKVRDWRFSHAMLPMGGMHTEDLMRGLFARRSATVTLPDGSEKRYTLIPEYEEREEWA